MEQPASNVVHAPPNSLTVAVDVMLRMLGALEERFTAAIPVTIAAVGDDGTLKHSLYKCVFMRREAPNEPVVAVVIPTKDPLTGKMPLIMAVTLPKELDYISFTETLSTLYGTLGDVKGGNIVIGLHAEETVLWDEAKEAELPRFSTMLSQAALGATQFVEERAARSDDTPNVRITPILRTEA